MHCLDNNESISLPIPYKTELQRLLLLEYVDTNYNLTPKGVAVLIDIAKCEIKKTKGTPDPRTQAIDFKDNVKKYIDLFPSGVVSGKALRASVTSVAPRFIWFFANYPEYGWDVIYNATKRYLQSVTDMEYCKTSGYFIKKDDKNKNTVSLLSDWCAATIGEDDVPDLPPNLGFNKLA